MAFANWISVGIYIITAFNSSVNRGNHKSWSMHYLYFVDYKKKVLTIVDDAFIRKLEYDVSFDCTKEKKNDMA